MKRILVFMAIIAFAFSLAVCSKAPKIQPPPPPQVQVPPPPPEYRKAAIDLFLKADSNLNLYRETSHTLIVCIYELRHPNAFNQLIDEQDGLTKLLECNQFDGSVAYVKKLILLPGQEVSEVLDQAEGAKYIGLVGGYFAPAKEKPYGLYRIPMTAGNEPASMKIDLYLGPQMIQDMDAKAPGQEMTEQNTGKKNKLLALKNIEDGHAANRMQHYEEAIAFFKNALEHNPDQADAYAGMSIAFHHIKQHSQALKTADTALQMDPKSCTGHYAVALIMYNDKKYDKALESISKAIEFCPQSPSYLYFRGGTYLKLQNNKSALKDFEQACKMSYLQACQSADRLKRRLKVKKKH